MDVDHFKDVNDRHGHLIGDRVLRQLAHQVGSRTRSGDTVARYGGEEFAILLPDTRLADAAQIAEHIREGIGKLNMRRTDTGTPIGTVTASFGVAEFHREETAQEFISRADAALYSAKRQGRNRVVSAPD
jgi:diguanylate cyclase